MKMYALTGGVGAGKSTALGLFSKFGVKTLSADKIVHDLYTKDWVQKGLQEIFGDQVINSEGNVNIKELATIIFSYPQERLKLEAYIHPLVIDQIIKQAQGELVICEVPLYFEMQSHLRDLFTGVIYVAASGELQTKRALERSHGNSHLSKRQSVKVKDDDVIHLADYVIQNDGTLAELEQKVQKLLERL